MKNNIVVMIIGVLLVCFGLLASYIRILSFFPVIIFYWVGFLAILGSTKYSKKKIIWWASFAILLHVLLCITDYILLQFCVFLSNTNTPMSIQLPFFKINDISRFIAAPVKHFFPHSQEILPDGRIMVHVYPLRENIITFFNVATYLFIGILIGYIRSKKYHRKMKN